MLRMIDHIVILVRDLDRASADYAAAGFTVTPGGAHAAGTTHNALITFDDGSYFELIAFFEPDRPQEHRWWGALAHGEGVVDYALLSDNLAGDAAALRERGLAVKGPEAGGRLRPDQQRLVWRSMLLGRDVGYPALPFVIEDVTARDLRVPGGAAAGHQNGSRGVAGLTLVTDDFAAAGAAFAGLLGTTGQEQHSQEGSMLRFPIGAQWLALLQPADAGSPAGQHLQTRGASPYEVVLAGAESGDPGAGDLLSLTLTHGARLRLAR